MPDREPGPSPFTDTPTASPSTFMTRFLRTLLSGRFARASSHGRKSAPHRPQDWETLERALLRRIESRLERERRRA